jgi:tetratricopeptide (TPR) repeat protein
LKRLDIRALRDEAYHILDESDGDVAVLQAMEALEKSPKDVESFLRLGELAEEKERYDKALVWINQGLLQHPASEALLLKKASLLLDGFEEVDEAYAILVELKSLFGEDISAIKKKFDLEIVLDTYLLLTDCYRLKYQYKDAFLYAKLACVLAPSDEDALLALATAHFELGDYEAALQKIEPIDTRKNQCDFYWLKAQILCASGDCALADDTFALANKIDKNRYHRPIRMSQSCFFSALEQAILALPKEIRDFINGVAVEIKDVLPREIIIQKSGTISPMACVYYKEENKTPTIYLFQRTIENLAFKKSEVRDLIASALLHELLAII